MAKCHRGFFSFLYKKQSVLVYRQINRVYTELELRCSDIIYVLLVFVTVVFVSAL